jgi:hypothetical protein
MKYSLTCWLPICLIATVAAIPAFGQRDFLTPDEVEKVRDAQEPNARLKLYLLFARQRMDQLQQLFAKEKKGRSIMARELLEDYAGIIDAIDSVSDDALKRKVDIAAGTNAVNDAERRFLSQLQKVQDSSPADIDLYHVALQEAIAATSDSLDLAASDADKRAAELAAKEEQEKKDARRIVAAEDSKGKSAETPDDGTKTADAANPDAANPEDKPKRKPPTLLRPGEKLGDLDQPTK